MGLLYLLWGLSGAEVGQLQIPQRLHHRGLVMVLSGRHLGEESLSASLPPETPNNNFRMPLKVLKSFYTCTIESILTGNITVWFGIKRDHLALWCGQLNAPSDTGRFFPQAFWVLNQ